MLNARIFSVVNTKFWIVTVNKFTNPEIVVQIWGGQKSRSRGAKTKESSGDRKDLLGRIESKRGEVSRNTKVSRNLGGFICFYVSTADLN